MAIAPLETRAAGRTVLRTTIPGTQWALSQLADATLVVEER